MSKGVSKTANEALTCKQAAFGYGEEYVSRKTPLLNRVYRTRGLIMHKLVSAAINELKKLHEMCDVQLVILGGGLDTSYDLYRSKVFVVDFEDIINKRKASYQSPLPAHVQLIAGDLCHTEEIKTCLLQSGLHFSAPTVILVECVLGYVDHDSCDRLLQMLANELLNSFIVLYDPVLPHGNPEIDGFAQLMYDKFSERGAPLLSCARTVEEYGDRLTSAGWAHVLTASVNEAQLLFLNKEERTKVSTVEPFDEFASLALLQNCYAVCVASTHAANFGQLMSTLLAVGCGAPRAAGGEEGSQDVDVAQRLRRLEIRAALAERRLTCLEERRRTRTHRTQCHNRTAQANGYVFNFQNNHFSIVNTTNDLFACYCIVG